MSKTQASVIAGNCSRTQAVVAVLFVPGLYVCLLLAALISLAVASLIIWLLWYLMVETERISLQAITMMVLVAVGGLNGAAAAAYGGWKALERATIQSRSVPVLPNEAPYLRAMLTDLSQSMSTQVPDNILIEFGISFFVTQAKVVCFGGRVKGRTLCLSAPLLRILNAEELKAVLAHELAHFSGLDTQYSIRFYPVYRGTQSALREIYNLQRSRSGYENYMLLPQLLSAWILESYLRTFGNLERKISREREMRADLVASDVVSSEALGSALKKVYGYGNLWSHVAERSLLNSLQEGKIYRNFCQSFLEYAYQHPTLVEAMVSDSTYTPSHPTDTHSQLGSRLSALGVSHEFKACNGLGPMAVLSDEYMKNIEEQLMMLQTQILVGAVPESQ